MLIELDYETVSALESALIVAEDSKMRDAKDWGNIAESMGAANQRQAAEDLAAFCRKQANSYRKAMDALQTAKRRAPMPDGADTGAQCIKTMFILPQI